MSFNQREINQIKDAIKNHTKENQSDGKVTVTIAQCLLMMINSAEKNTLSENIIERLKLLYLNGIRFDKERYFIEEMVDSFKDKNYTVVEDPKSIYLDPSRRYFESHLAYHILKKEASKLDYGELKYFTLNLYNYLLESNISTEEKNYISAIVFKDSEKFELLNGYQFEYSEVINKLKNHNFYGLPAEVCNNLCEVAKNTILSAQITVSAETLPANVYGDSVFTFGVEGRGIIGKTASHNNKSAYKGVMLSINPVPLDDITLNTTENGLPLPSPFQRSTDRSYFMIENKWIQNLFSRQTQVFSAGISGTTLAQLRNILTQKRLGKPWFSEYFKKYITVYASLMLFNSGGHSLFEIFEVLKIAQLHEIMEAIRIDHLIKNDEIMSTLLYKDQKDAFNAAIEEAISFNQQIIKRAIMMSQLKKKNNGNKIKNKSGINSPQGFTLRQAILTLDYKKFDEYLIALKNKKALFNEAKENGNLVLMLVVQSGKLDHLKLLIKNGFDIYFKFRYRATTSALDLSILEIAVKSNQQHIVDYLLKNHPDKFPIITENSKTQFNITNSSLRSISPSLYFASRSNNSFILTQLLENQSVTLDHKLLALQESVKVESLQATNTIISNLSLNPSISKIDYKYTRNLIKKAIERGNIELIDILLKSKLYENFELNYDNIIFETLKSQYISTVLFFGREEFHNKYCQNKKEGLTQQNNKRKKIEGETILHIAVENRNENDVQSILSFIKDPEIKKELLEAKDKYGVNVLHFAASDGNEKIIKVILNHIKNIEHLTEHHTNTAIESIVNIATKEGMTPLHIATQEGYTNIVKLLVENGASIDIENKNGETPLCIATRRGHSDIVKILEEKKSTLYGGAPSFGEQITRL